MVPSGGYSHGLLNPNPGSLVANMTSKTKNCYDKLIIHQTKLKKMSNPL